MENLDRYPALKSIIMSSDEKRTEAHCYDTWVRGLEHLKEGMSELLAAEDMVRTEDYVPSDIKNELHQHTARISECIDALEAAVQNLKHYDSPQS